jgi:hypothetical protein
LQLVMESKGWPFSDHAEQRVLWVRHQRHPEEHQQSEEGSEEGGMGNALRLVSKKDAQTFHNAGRLQGIIAQGAEHTTLCAGLGNPQPTGVVRRGSSIPQTIWRQVPPEADNYGGLE